MCDLNLEADVQCLELREGDRLLVKLREPRLMDQMRAIRDQVAEAFELPESRVVMLQGLDLEVASS